MSSNYNFDSYNKISRLSEQQLEELWHNYLEDKTQKALRDKLIVQYIYLTRYVLGRMKVSLPPTFGLEDITGFGIEGLIDAIEKFTPDKCARFETYALIRIRGTIIDRIRSADWLSRSARKKVKDVKNTTEELKQKLGRSPTTQEIASKMGIEPEKVSEILSEDSTIGSIYEKRGGDEGIEIIDTIQDANRLGPEEQMEEKDAKRELEEALKRLPERERMILVLYYHENMTLKEIGQTISVSESRVCQLHAQAIMKLRNLLSSKRTNRLTKSIIG